jgi:F0F1-type ATP synthase membrane subunit b/b'
MEKARKEASVIVEQAYADADKKRQEILKEAEIKSKIISDSVNQKTDLEKMHVTREKFDLAVKNVAERIVNTLGHR